MPRLGESEVNRVKRSDPNHTSGFLGTLAKILAPKLGPFSAALVLIGGIGAVAVVATAAVLHNPTILLGLFVLLGFLAVLLLVDRHLTLPERGTGDAPGRPHRIDGSAAQAIRAIMDITMQKISAKLEMPLTDVRGNMFEACGDGQMRMCTQVAIRMTVAEQTISMPVGYGATGQAAEAMLPKLQRGTLPVDANGQPTGERIKWGEADLTASEAGKVHERLSWIISAPFQGVLDGVTRVINIDGLQERSESDLQGLIPDVLGCAAVAAQLV